MTGILVTVCKVYGALVAVTFTWIGAVIGTSWFRDRRACRNRAYKAWDQREHTMRVNAAVTSRHPVMHMVDFNKWEQEIDA